LYSLKRETAGSSKQWHLSAQLHGVILQMRVIIILFAVKTSNLTHLSGSTEAKLCSSLCNCTLHRHLDMIKLKFTLETGHEGSQDEHKYSSTLSLTLAQLNRPPPPRKTPKSHFIGGWVGLRAGLDRCRKSCSHRDMNPEPCSLHTDYTTPARHLDTEIGKYGCHLW
jgi:hypothetical protein